jgi:hypothetical protein
MKPICRICLDSKELDLDFVWCQCDYFIEIYNLQPSKSYITT